MFLLLLMISGNVSAGRKYIAVTSYPVRTCWAPRMFSLRFAVPAILAAAAVAACFSYFVAPACTRRNVAIHVRLPPAVLYSTGPNARGSISIDQPPNVDEQAAAAYQKAAEAILRRAPNTQASAANDELPMTGRIPLPKRRPIAR